MSVLGLVIGVSALVISMALMAGYRNDLQDKLLGGNAELFVYAIDGPIKNVDSTLTALKSIPSVAEASPVVFQHALVSTESFSTGEQIMLKGVEPGRARTSPMLGKIVGSRATFAAPDGTAGVAVGRHLAAKLGLSDGDAVTLTLPTENSGSFLPKTGTFMVTRIYETGFFEFDSRWMFMDLREAEALLENTGGPNLIEIKLRPEHELDDVVPQVERATGRRYAVSDWREMNQQLFSLLAIQQLVLFIVIGLIVFVSTFNIVSTLIMTVHEKRKEIGIMISMGGEQKLIRNIFIWYGGMVGAVGTAAGLILGVTVSWIITRYELVSFGPEIAEVYFVSSIPFLTRPGDLAAIALFAITVSFIATILPSLRASRLNPIEALRHE